MPSTTRRKQRRRQAETGQTAQISLETERLVPKNLDIVLYNGATVDFPICVNSLLFRKVVRRETKHFYGNWVHGIAAPLGRGLIQDKAFVAVARTDVYTETE